MRTMLWLFGLLVAIAALGCAVTPINIPHSDGLDSFGGQPTSDLRPARLDLATRRDAGMVPPRWDAQVSNGKDARADGSRDLQPVDGGRDGAKDAPAETAPKDAGKPKTEAKP